MFRVVMFTRDEDNGGFIPARSTEFPAVDEAFSYFMNMQTRFDRIITALGYEAHMNVPEDIAAEAPNLIDASGWSFGTGHLDVVIGAFDFSDR